MAYMELRRGIHTGEVVQYPIYDITIPNGSAIHTATMYASPTTYDSAISVTFANNADISSSFPAEIPRTAEQDGCICQNDYKYIDNVPNWTLKTQAFSAIPIGTKPNDWDKNYFDYYTATVRNLSGHTCTTFSSTIAGGWYYNACPPQWSSTTAYYHDDLPVKQRTTHIFSTDNNFTFGVNVAPNYQYDYVRGVTNCNPEHPIVRAELVSALHDPNGVKFTISGVTADEYATYQLQSGFINSIPFISIFVHFVYNDIDYWGVAQVLMSSTISETAHPIGIRVFGLPLSYWGTSIHGGTPEQGGNWGGNAERAGGDGTFSAPSNNDGDRNGTSLLSAISAANTTFKTVLGGNYNLYYVPPTDLTKILAVLYSSDYFQRFENSMYNPLSAVLNCALIPEIFCSYSASVSDMTAAGYNISQNIFPNHVQFASPEPLIMRHIGDIDIPNYFGAFPDYAPYTQCNLHLPYIGEITIDINKIANGTLSIDYVCDVMSGNVTAWIWCNDRDGNHTYCYNATGNCAYSIPLFANSSDGLAIGKIIGGIASIAAGNVFSGVASTASGAAGTISRHTQISGTFSGNVGLTTNPKCFAEFSRPQWVNPEYYQNQSGIPSQISGILSDFRGGFVQVETIDLQNVPATEAELAEIESLLESGIYYVSN